MPIQIKPLELENGMLYSGFYNIRVYQSLDNRKWVVHCIQTSKEQTYDNLLQVEEELKMWERAFVWLELAISNNIRSAEAEVIVDSWTGNEYWINNFFDMANFARGRRMGNIG